LRRLNSVLPQGNVLAPILFNFYLSDLPSTAAQVFQYADDIAVTYQAKTFDECENNLEADIELLNHRSCLQPNPGKTEMCVFHLNTHAANKQLDVMVNGTSIKHVNHPKYLLGVTLDRTLTFKSHLENQISPRVGALIDRYEMGNECTDFANGISSSCLLILNTMHPFG
jgi:hypothetical protein